MPITIPLSPRRAPLSRHTLTRLLRPWIGVQGRLGGALLLLLATAPGARAQVTRCWYPCGSDQITVTWDKTATPVDHVTVHTSSPHPDDMRTVCHPSREPVLAGSPEPPTLAGKAARRRALSAAVAAGELFCQQRPTGQCLAVASLETSPTHGQASFEALWGLEAACPPDTTPLFVWVRRSDVTACLAHAGQVVQTITAECTYPYAEMQTYGDPRDPMSVTAPCLVTRITPHAVGACAMAP